jgi:hypothetical protein
MERDEYRDDQGPEGMQAQAEAGAHAEKVQTVLADELFHFNATLKLLARSISVMVMLTGFAIVYMVFHPALYCR